MIQRCFNKKAKEYRNYGGRSITLCEEWLGDNGFLNFYKWSMDNGYEYSLTIDRINVDKNYSPKNCRWVTMKVQGNNRRNNKKICYNGETHTLKEWEELLGFKRGCLQTRLARGWDIDRAFNEPVGYIKPGYNKYSYRMKNKQEEKQGEKTQCYM